MENLDDYISKFTPAEIAESPYLQLCTSTTIADIQQRGGLTRDQLQDLKTYHKARLTEYARQQSVRESGAKLLSFTFDPSNPHQEQERQFLSVIDLSIKALE